MRKNSGLVNEDELIKAIDGKRFDELGKNLQFNLKALFDGIDNDVFHAEKTDPAGKPDIKLTYHGLEHFMSVKSGAAEHIHSEEIKKFILAIREKGISTKTQKTILKFQFGDGTLDGTGKIRMDYEHLYYKLKDEIALANIELNQNKDFVVDMILKFIFFGNNKNLQPADCIYFGEPDYGVLATPKQITKHLQRKSYSYLNNLHIGPVLFAPRARYVNFIERSPEQRYWVSFRWVQMERDLNYISRRYDD